MGDGWDARLADAFRDCPETRALVTCDLVALRPCELCPELPMWLLDDGDDVLGTADYGTDYCGADYGGGYAFDADDTAGWASKQSHGGAEWEEVDPPLPGEPPQPPQAAGGAAAALALPPPPAEGSRPAAPEGHMPC